MRPPGNAHLYRWPPKKTNRFHGLSTIPTTVQRNPPFPKNLTSGHRAEITMGSLKLLKILTFQDSLEQRRESRAFANQPSDVRKHQPAPENAHLSVFFGSNRLLKRLTLCLPGTTDTTDFAALQRNPVKTHLGPPAESESPTASPHSHHHAHSCPPVKAHLKA